MRSPIIGITCETYTEFSKMTGHSYDTHAVTISYIRAVENAGGTPVLLPLLEKKEQALNLLNAIDGLLLTGGEDIDPALYNEEPRPDLSRLDTDKDRLEMWIIKSAVGQNMPIFGICRGVQMLNVVMGGSLYQDVKQFSPDVLKHYQQAPRYHATHDILVERGSRLFDIVDSEIVRVNSFHHQAIKDLAPGLVITARARDSIIEGIESWDYDFLLGIQCHPEGMWDYHPQMAALFATFVNAAQK